MRKNSSVLTTIVKMYKKADPNLLTDSFDEVANGETVVGIMDKEIKRLYIVSAILANKYDACVSGWKERVSGEDFDLAPTEVKKKLKKEAFSAITRDHAWLTVAADLLEASVREEFNLYNNVDVGFRKGFKIVSYKVPALLLVTRAISDNLDDEDKRILH